MTPTSAALLRDVADAIIASGYAVPPQPLRQHIARRAHIEVLAHDPRLTSTACRGEMVRHVMVTYQVSNVNARKMLYQARKMRESQQE